MALPRFPARMVFTPVSHGFIFRQNLPEICLPCDGLYKISLNLFAGFVFFGSRVMGYTNSPWNLCLFTGVLRNRLDGLYESSLKFVSRVWFHWFTAGGLYEISPEFVFIGILPRSPKGPGQGFKTKLKEEFLRKLYHIMVGHISFLRVVLMTLPANFVRYMCLSRASFGVVGYGLNF